MAERLCGLTPTASFRASFEGATVQEVAVNDEGHAGAMFSNGRVIELTRDGDTWTIIELAALGRHFFE
jgi:hypothetical protein